MIFTSIAAGIAGIKDLTSTLIPLRIMTRYFLTAVLLIVYLMSNGQDIPVHAGYTILAQEEGDLTKDSIAEKVIVFNTDDSTDFGTIREIDIYKKSDNKWSLLASSKNAIGRSEDGGMMGDPFESIEIKDGILIIKQSGGSCWKWFKTDKYRFQNNAFELIGYTNIYGKACEYFENVDFNLSTGEIIYNKDYEYCDQEGQKAGKDESETFYKKGLKINLTNRTSNEIKIVTPKYKSEIYL